MKADLLVRSKWMVSREFGTDDIPREPLVTITGVKKPDEKEELTRNWWLLTFKEPFAKPLKIITTHQQALILMFGGETDNWIGKRIKVAAIVGVYFKKRQTAVRILGSPDIKEAKSFSVRSFGGGSDVYNLVPTVEASSAKPNATPPAPFVSDGTVRIGPKKGTQIAQLTHDELAAAVTLGTEQLAKAKPGATWIPNAQAHVEELKADVQRRAKLEEEMSGGAPVAEHVTEEQAPF